MKLSNNKILITGDASGNTKVCDLSDEADRIELYNWIAENHPDLNVLVNNAGVQYWMNISDPGLMRLLMLHQGWHLFHFQKCLCIAFVESVFEQMKNGKTELTFQTSEARAKANNDVILDYFNKMNP